MHQSSSYSVGGYNRPPPLMSLEDEAVAGVSECACVLAVRLSQPAGHLHWSVSELLLLLLRREGVQTSWRSVSRAAGLHNLQRDSAQERKDSHHDKGRSECQSGLIQLRNFAGCLPLLANRCRDSVSSSALG